MYKTISNSDSIGRQEPKEFPLYVTQCKSRKPEIKYQTAGPAKLALRNHLGVGMHWKSKFTVYKWNGEEYIAIFDTESELCNAYRNGKIKEKELMKIIPW